MLRPHQRIIRVGPNSVHGLDNDGVDLFVSRGSHYCAHDRGPSPRWHVLVMFWRPAARRASQGRATCPHPTSWRCCQFLARPVLFVVRLEEGLPSKAEAVGHGVLDGQSLTDIMGSP